MAPTTTNILPASWGTTVGTVSQPAIPANPTRGGLIIINAGTVVVALCPSSVNLGALGVYTGFAPGVAVINGPGSVTMQPGDKFIFDTVSATAAWNAIAASTGGAITFFEH